MPPLKHPAQPFFLIAGLCLLLLGLPALPLPVTTARTRPNSTPQPELSQPKATGFWTRSGPEGGAALALAFHPTNPAIMFAGGRSGLFRSTDGGANWAESDAGMTNFELNTITITPTNPLVMYAGTIPGLNEPAVFKSLDGGVSWKAASQGIGEGNCEGLVIHPQNPNILYLAGGGTIYKSTDGGASWVKKPVGLPQTGTNQSLVMDPLVPETLYALRSNEGVYKSANGGESWTSFSTGLALTSYGTLAIDPINPATLYVGYYFGGIAKSVNGGLTWFPTGLTGSNGITEVVVDPQNSNRVYAATVNLGLMKSENGGLNWNPVNTGLPQLSLSAFNLFPGNPTLLLASTSGLGLYKSVNSGGNWNAASQGLFFTTVWSLAAHPANPEIAYIGLYDRSFVKGGVAKTTDGGQTWTDLNLPGQPNVYSLAVHPTNPNIILAGSGAPYRSTDGGLSWAGGAPPISQYVPALSFAPSAPNIVYAVVSPLGVLKSTDTGLTWTAANTGLPTPPDPIDAMGVDPTNPNRVFAADLNGNMYGSTNGGANWSLLASLPTASLPTGILVDPRNPLTLLVGFRNNGIYRSTNGGTTWSWVSSAYFRHTNSLTFAPNNPDYIYETYGNEVYQSLNGGLSWARLPTVGLNTSYTYGVAVSLSGRVLVGAEGGVFRGDDLVGSTVTRFYPLASAPGKTITITGTNFLPGTQVFFGGTRRIPAASVLVDTPTQIRVVVPPTGPAAASVYGFLTIRVPGYADITTENLPVNTANPADPNATNPRFVLWGDTTLGGDPLNTSDLTLERAFLQFQAVPNADQRLAGDLVPLNANGSRGNGVLSATDFTWMRAVASGQILD